VGTTNIIAGLTIARGANPTQVNQRLKEDRPHEPEYRQTTTGPLNAKKSVNLRGELKIKEDLSLRELGTDPYEDSPDTAEVLTLCPNLVATRLWCT